MCSLSSREVSPVLGHGPLPPLPPHPARPTRVTSHPNPNPPIRPYRHRCPLDRHPEPVRHVRQRVWSPVRQVHAQAAVPGPRLWRQQVARWHARVHRDRHDHLLRVLEPVRRAGRRGGLQLAAREAGIDVGGPAVEGPDRVPEGAESGEHVAAVGVGAEQWSRCWVRRGECGGKRWERGREAD